MRADRLSRRGIRVGTIVLAILMSRDAESAAATVRVLAASHTLYEHQDHRMLPIGTKIFFARARGAGAASYVRPGQPMPAAFAGRVPDVIVVGPYDARATAVIERTRPAQACCGRYNAPAR